MRLPGARPCPELPRAWLAGARFPPPPSSGLGACRPARLAPPPPPWPARASPQACGRRCAGGALGEAGVSAPAGPEFPAGGVSVADRAVPAGVPGLAGPPSGGGARASVFPVTRPGPRGFPRAPHWRRSSSRPPAPLRSSSRRRARPRRVRLSGPGSRCPRRGSLPGSVRGPPPCPPPPPPPPRAWWWRVAAGALLPAGPAMGQAPAPVSALPAPRPGAVSRRPALASSRRHRVPGGGPPRHAGVPSPSRARGGGGARRWRWRRGAGPRGRRCPGPRSGCGRRPGRRPRGEGGPGGAPRLAALRARARPPPGGPGPVGGGGPSATNPRGAGCGVGPRPLALPPRGGPSRPARSAHPVPRGVRGAAPLPGGVRPPSEAHRALLPG